MSVTPNQINPTDAFFVILGNQLFPFASLRKYRDCTFFMAEDEGLCTYVKHHKQKIVLFLAAMRSYRDALRKNGCRVMYRELPAADADPEDYETKLLAYVEKNKPARLLMWEIEDRFFERRIAEFAATHDLSLTFLPSPMFLTSRSDFADWLADNRPHMADFYRWQRNRMGILLDGSGRPEGGHWSYDSENRLALPADVDIPEVSYARPTDHVRDAIKVVERRFGDHPGRLSRDNWWLPTTRPQALAWLREFLDRRFDLFGPYEDALSARAPMLFHSVLSPAMNLGLITPDEVISRTLEHAKTNAVRINSVEGLVRQIIGWREFVRGVYQQFGKRQEQSNFFGHHRKLTADWYAGTTGVVPLDGMIEKALRFGWAHHIERLMIAGNLMTLCEVEPREAYRWFMEMFVDSSDWVMVPNVYGMGLFADGGIFATKPYICGSNYILKMSDDARPTSHTLFDGEECPWTDVLDGLYWRFIGKNREFFKRQARMGQAVGTLDRMNEDRRRHKVLAAERFLHRVTRP